MQLLGNYQSSISSYQFQELVTLLQASIQLGEYSGGFTFNQADLEALQTQAQAFNILPQPSAGNRSSDDSFNNPINLLSARFSAILLETISFEQQLSSLITLLQSNTTLIDKLICSSRLENWKDTLPVLNSNKFSWDFGIGYGPITSAENAWSWTDPLTNLCYGQTVPPLISTIIGNEMFTGLSCNTKNTSFTPSNLNWSSNYTPTTSQYGLNWAELTVISEEQLITYSAPNVSPTNIYYSVTGISNLGGLPIYVRIGHTPRVNMLNINSLVNGTPLSLSNYEIDTNQVFVTKQPLQSPGGNLFEYPGYTLPIIDNNNLYTQGVDYTITSNGLFTPLTLPTENINIQFVEYYPSYQCSTDQVHWSSLYMLDQLRPYQDGETLFAPINIDPIKGFPITDENNVPTGLYLSLLAGTTEEYILKVYSTANNIGASATLEVDFGELNTLNSIVIEPFTSFPLILQSVVVEGYTGLPWTGNVVINGKTTLRFPSSITSKIYLSFLQPSFSLAQIESPDSGNISLRRDIIAQLQQSIPTATQIINNSPSEVSSQYIYEFGLQNIVGQYLEPSSGIYTLGPYTSVGQPEIVNLTLDYTDATVLPLSESLQVNAVQGSSNINVLSGSGYTIGQTITSLDGTSIPVTNPPTRIMTVSGNTLTINNTVVSSIDDGEVILWYDSPIDTYLCYIAYNSSGSIIDENLSGMQINSGIPMVFPFNTGVTRSNITKVDLYLKFCHRTSEAVLQRFQLEVINA